MPFWRNQLKPVLELRLKFAFHAVSIQHLQNINLKTR